LQKQIAEARNSAAAPNARPGDGTPMSAADTMHAAGEQALRAGKREAAIDAFLAETAEHAAAGKLDAALDAALRALAVDPGSARIHLEHAELCRLAAENAAADERLGELANRPG